MSAAWDPKLRFSNHCGNGKAFFTGMTASGLFLDLIILTMPLPMIWNLMLSTRKRLEVSGVFLLGSFTCISSLIRILSIDQIKHEDLTCKPAHHINASRKSEEFVLMRLSVDTFLNTFLWSHVEPSTAIWCACLMTYRPLFQGIGLELRSIFSHNKQTPSNHKSFFGRKASADPNSDAWPSRGRLLRGRESVGYRDLSARTATRNLYVVNVFMEPSPPDHHSAPPADDHERSRFAAGRESSPV
ncbi:hypothetical protein MMC29_000814 [Sticta canariensis]|nr:hypothetical protein [Sticta canariensis]